MPKTHVYGLTETEENSNFKSLLKFVKWLRKDFKEGNKEAVRVDLNQIIGRCKNLLLELEENV